MRLVLSWLSGIVYSPRNSVCATVPSYIFEGLKLTGDLGNSLFQP